LEVEPIRQPAGLTNINVFKSVTVRVRNGDSLPTADVDTEPFVEVAGPAVGAKHQLGGERRITLPSTAKQSANIPPLSAVATTSAVAGRDRLEQRSDLPAGRFQRSGSWRSIDAARGRRAADLHDHCGHRFVAGDFDANGLELGVNVRIASQRGDQIVHGGGQADSSMGSGVAARRAADLKRGVAKASS
jgi:hypothetical protein